MIEFASVTDYISVAFHMTDRRTALLIQDEMKKVLGLGTPQNRVRSSQLHDTEHKAVRTTETKLKQNCSVVSAETKR